jgi:hypothetical protein
VPAMDSDSCDGILLQKHSEILRAGIIIKVMAG